jgi:hypothetical protein
MGLNVGGREMMMAYTSSDIGANIKGPEPNPSRYVVAPRITSNSEHPKSMDMATTAGVCTLDEKPTMPAMLVRITVYSPAKGDHNMNTAPQSLQFQAHSHFGSLGHFIGSSLSAS